MLESLFNKVAGLKPATLLRDCNTVNLRDFLQNTFFYKTLPVATPILSTVMD